MADDGSKEVFNFDAVIDSISKFEDSSAIEPAADKMQKQQLSPIVAATPSVDALDAAAFNRPYEVQKIHYEKA